MLLFFAVVLTMGRPIAARYISRGSTGAQAATVAKWGWTVSANSDALFGASYKKEGDSATVVNTSDKQLAVCATGAAELVAPGASGEMTFSIQGVPEVASSITIQITSASDIVLKKGETELYRPIKWTLKRGDTTLCSDSLTELIRYLENNGTATVAPGETSDLCGNYTLSWAWAFGGNDQYDSILGKKQSWYGSSEPDPYGDYTAELRLGLELSIEIEQVD